ncbi:uncharacterized protein LOC125037114 [Penaeus chinensis]|uniref:uncharacterized protein LOC125037114 n=1 Tax=Penaeus chinensis TaxID=139456 RepID=UPI001FB578EB|nr:uncharacterized protein LOC125037114 [Penaeus chinensis]
MSSGSDISEEILEEIQDEHEQSSLSSAVPNSLLPPEDLEGIRSTDDGIIPSWGSAERETSTQSPLLLSGESDIQKAEKTSFSPLCGEDILPELSQGEQSTGDTEAGISMPTGVRERSRIGIEEGGELIKRTSSPPRDLALDVARKVESRQSDNSPMSSEWSVESLRSSGSSLHIKDRSLSEISVSIPKLTVVSIEKEQKVFSLVKQFSEVTEDTTENYDRPAEKRRQSVPACTLWKPDTFMSLEPMKQEIHESESKWQTPGRKSSVSSIISHFSSQPSEEVSMQEHQRKESPRKLGQMSPRVRNSLEKITGHFSQNTSQDFSRGVLKNKENISPGIPPKRSLISQHSKEKENSPRCRSIFSSISSPLLEVEDVQFCETEIEDLCNIAFPSSKMSSYSESLNLCEEMLVEKSPSNEDKCSGSENQLFEDDVLETCDTDGEVEDMPEEKVPYQSANSVSLKDEGTVSDIGKSSRSPGSFPSWNIQLMPNSQLKGSACDKGNSSLGSSKNKSLEISDGVSNKSVDFPLEKEDELSVTSKNSSTRSVQVLESQCKDRSSSDAVRSVSECSEDFENHDVAEGSCEDDQSEILRTLSSKSGSREECFSSVDSDANPDEDALEAVESVSLCSLERDTSHELLELDIDGSGHDVFDGEFSEASEVILGFVSNSPISAITERTEESGQDNDHSGGRRISDSTGESSHLQESAKEYETECQNVGQIQVSSASAIPGPVRQGGFPSLPVNIGSNINSSQFANSHSLQETVSPVQTQPSLEAGDDQHDSSQNPTSRMAQKPPVIGVKQKLCKFPVVPRGQRAGEKPSAAQVLPTSKMSLTGPVKPTLCRNTSKSMHNLGTSTNSKASRAQGLHNRSLSLSTDNLENSSPRTSSLSPAPQSGCRGRRNSGSGIQGSLHRRCVSAIALNEGDGQLGMKRNKSLSLSRLNRSRSSSMNSIASYKKADYSHVQSKVKQYIRDVKERDMRNSTRSLPSTPARKAVLRNEADVIMINERMLKEFGDLKPEDLPEDIKKLKSKVLGEGGDPKVLEHILRLILEERKSRHASDTTLAALQLRYDNLNTKYAEKQNEIDRLRFFKDIHINKDYTITLRAQEEGRLNAGSNWSSRNTTPPNTPYKSLTHYNTSPNTPQRRSSCHMTPPNTPNIRSLSPSLAPNLVKSTSTPLVDPLWSFALDPSGSYTYRDSLPVDLNKDPSLIGDQERAKDGGGGLGQDGASLQNWMKETNSVLQKVKDFTVLQGHGAVQQSERNIIWQHILHEYWRLAGLFPMLTLVSPTHEPGMLLQKLGKALQVTAGRFDLELNIARPQECDDTQLLQHSNVVEDARQLRSNGKFGPEWSSFDKSESQEVTSAGNQVKVSVAIQEKSKSDKLSFEYSKSAFRSEEFIPQIDDLQKSNRNPKHRHVDEQNSPEIPRRNSFNEEVTLKITKNREAPRSSKIQKDEKPNKAAELNSDYTVSQNVAKKSTPYSVLAEQEALLVNDKYDVEKDLPTNLEGEEGQLDLCSPAHSRESMQTVGPLEKVKLWQASLIDSLPVPGEYQSPPSTSAPPSILSVNSSEPFDAVEDLNDLSNLKLRVVNHDSSGSTNHNPEAGGFVDPPDTQCIADMGRCVDADSSLPINSPERPETEGDLPKSPWRSSSATPRMHLHQAVKARDLDSGCPGSERSTRMSHNASFEHPDQGSNFHPSLEAARDCVNEPEEREKSQVAESQCFSGFEKRSMGVESIPQEKGYVDRPLKHPTEGLPLDERLQRDVSMESRVHSGCSRSSRNSSKNKKDTQYSLLGLQDAQEQDFKENLSKSSAQRLLEDRDIAETSGDESNDYNRSRKRDPKRSTRTRKRSKSRRSLERNKPGCVKSTYGACNETRSNTPGSQMQEVTNKLHMSLDKIDTINQNLRKYRSKYISGYASDLSEASTSMHSSHSDIYSNISKLKRDFKILQSQMLNLKSEVFHEKKSMIRESSRSHIAQRGRKSEPMRALDISRHLDEDTHLGVDSSMDASHSELVNRTQLQMEDRVRWKNRTSSRVYENNPRHSYNFSSDSSVSTFDDSRMDQLPKSTPKDRLKGGSSERRARRDLNSKNGNRSIRVEKHESFNDSSARRQLDLSKMEVIDINSPRKDNRPISTQTLSPGQNIGVQTEDRVVPSIRCTPSPRPLNPLEDFKTSQTQLSEVVSEAAGMLNLESDVVSVKQRLNTSAPLVYIQNYHCNSDISKSGSAGDSKKHGPGTPKRKHHRSASSQLLIESLNEVTGIAERVRLRSESMLSCLDLHISVHENINK